MGFRVSCFYHSAVATVCVSLDVSDGSIIYIIKSVEDKPLEDKSVEMSLY